MCMSKGHATFHFTQILRSRNSTIRACDFQLHEAAVPTTSRVYEKLPDGIEPLLFAKPELVEPFDPKTRSY